MAPFFMRIVSLSQGIGANLDLAIEVVLCDGLDLDELPSTIRIMGYFYPPLPINVWPL
ncbi:hypothetical protein [Paracoccus fistulariae]|uniref:hypothetical protein n=1 Tax=Paracoccus fistulariae TaxID=658446 RepID=UPI002330F93E|nr:hypothetical protein [Paracoccus fistulariae]MDB6180625.1 hypothetical protein [Paracoccus fistulariae]